MRQTLVTNTQCVVMRKGKRVGLRELSTPFLKDLILKLRTLLENPLLPECKRAAMNKRIADITEELDKREERNRFAKFKQMRDFILQEMRKKRYKVSNGEFNGFKKSGYDKASDFPNPKHKVRREAPKKRTT